jgi:lipid II:glycine glycyltransferase (peptidoglycan interpeptide bridge formation enzyme)
MFIDQPRAWSFLDPAKAGALSNRSAVTVRDDIAPDDWDALIAEFDDAAQDSSHAYRSAVWGDRRVSRVAVMHKGRIIGAALAVVMLVPPFGRGVAHLRAGPLWRRKGEPINPAVLSTVLDAVSEYYVSQRRLCLKILPPADPRFSGAYVEALAELGFARTELKDDNRYLVNTAIDAEQQMASLGQKWRYNLKKALKTDLDIRIEAGGAAVDIFDRLFREMERRKVYQGDTWHPVCAGLRRGFPDAVKPSIVIVRLGGQPIAGAVIGHIGDTAHYIYGATADIATGINAGFAMHWWIVNWLHGQGYRWYDLGGESGDQGLRQFKKGLVGRDGATAPLAGEFTMCSDSFSRLINHTLDLIRATKLKLKRSRLKRQLMAMLPGSGMRTQS